MNENIKNKINNTLQSLDGLTPAEPKPFLLTRVNAQIAARHSQESSNWSKIATFIKRPVVAICTILFITAVNIAALTETGYLTSKNTAKKVTAATSRYDFAINVSGIYDIENQEP